MGTHPWQVGLLALAGGCAAAAAAPDAGCRDAGPNTLCGEPQAFAVQFAGLDFPLEDDAGHPLPTRLEVFLADQDLSPACGGSTAKLTAFTGLEIQVDGRGAPVDAGTFSAPSAWAYELQWSPDGGPNVLASSATATVVLTHVSGAAAVGSFDAEMSLPAGGLVPLSGSFSVKSCPGLHRALR